MVIVFAYKGSMDSATLRNDIVKRYNNIIESTTYVDIFYKNRVPYASGGKKVSITHTDIGNGERIELVAISDSAVGIDIEARDRTLKYDVSSRFYTKDERAYVGDDRSRLLEIWQKKEAYGKSLRVGVYTDNVMDIDGFREYNLYDGYRTILYTKEEDIFFVTI